MNRRPRLGSPLMRREVRATAVVVVVGLALELAATASYVYVASRWPSPGKAVVLASFALAMTMLLALAVRRLNRMRRVILVFLLSIGLVGVVEGLAWTLFPGLRHDLAEFSLANITRMIGVWTLGVVAFGCLMFVLSIPKVASPWEGSRQ